MSRIGIPAMLGRLHDRLDNAANPMMMKALYQSVHSRGTMVLFRLALVAVILAGVAADPSP